ncbi:MAG TPA: VC_2705 family sodium/solute symporter [Bacteroidales bacterium]|nr:VC_2705 family sodium/solute symporter [Bacteroidales bacterium]HPF01732.1 VC_2705 family sodium/solute symporter [Bacteroidales bacterium]HPJ59748.1 VC_2705 family sodium/solute symporter [Bacteroidales bacterium]HPR11788.1 VC_2705 family sodium/solute symporter [Bacteroidales bacterium]HRW84063.1 VC_2705 family sodium/solute symporter [Bacteroidales bacterium]
MKKISISLLLILSAVYPLHAESLTQLEGSFKTGPAIILIAILLTFVLVGVFFRAKDPADYYAAGRKISRVGSGMAIASNWMSAASVLGMAGMMYGFGYNGLAYVVGWTGGYVLLLILMAAQIRKYGKYTAPDFIGDRYYSRGLRIVSAVFTILISFAYCVGQFGGIGLMFKWILGLNYAWAVIIGSSVVLLYTLISGMIGATKNMQVQYIIIVISFLVPVFILAFKFDYFWLLPQIGYGAAVTDIVQGIPAPNIADGVAMVNAYGHDLAIVPSPEFAMPWDPSTGTTFFQWMAICFSLMVGTAGLPHVIQRFYVVPRVTDARWSVVWGLFFICLVYWTAPAYSAFGKLLSSNPDVGLLAKDAIVVYTAQLGGVNSLIVGLLAAGAVSAAFSTVSGLLVAGASAFSHDLYVRVINPSSTPKSQLKVARIGTVIMAVAVTVVALMKLGLIAQLVSVAFSMAACTIFPLFLLGIWWSGSNRAGAKAGLLAGSLVTLVSLTYFIVGLSGKSLPGQDFVSYWLNVWYFAWIGAPLAVIVNIIVSLLTKPTPLEIKKFLAEQVHN